MNIMFNTVWEFTHYLSWSGGNWVIFESVIKNTVLVLCLIQFGNLRTILAARVEIG